MARFIDHKLKIWETYFADVIELKKRFEIREAKDRYFEVGDVVLLEEYIARSHIDGEYTGRKALVVIRYVTTYEQKKGNVVFGFDLLKTEL